MSENGTHKADQQNQLPPGTTIETQLLLACMKVLQHAREAEAAVQRSLLEIRETCDHAKSALPGAASPQQVAENILGKIRTITERIANREFPQYVVETSSIIHVLAKIVMRMEANEALAVRSRTQIEVLLNNQEILERRLDDLATSLHAKQTVQPAAEDENQLRLTDTEERSETLAHTVDDGAPVPGTPENPDADTEPA